MKFLFSGRASSWYHVEVYSHMGLGEYCETGKLLYVSLLTDRHAGLLKKRKSSVEAEPY